ncbi:MAG: hypothetical protein JW795_19515 [Chitinivibrionales bacterium]|nr:hypothetical protein [Chitinivibrionales bacterium]
MIDESGKFFEEILELFEQLVFPIVKSGLADANNCSDFALRDTLPDEAKKKVFGGIHLFQMAGELIQQQTVEHSLFHVYRVICQIKTVIIALIQRKCAPTTLVRALAAIACAAGTIRLQTPTHAFLLSAFCPTWTHIGLVHFLCDLNLLSIQHNDEGLGFSGMIVIIFHFSSLDFLIDLHWESENREVGRG